MNVPALCFLGDCLEVAVGTVVCMLYVQVKDAQVLGQPGGKSGWRGKGSGKFSKKRKYLNLKVK